MPKLSEVLAQQQQPKAPTQAPRRLRLSDVGSPEPTPVIATVRPPPEPSLMEQFGRQVGLTGRHALEGVADLLGIVTDPIGHTVDAVLPGESGRYMPLGQATSELADRMGLPTPEPGIEQTVGSASRALAGTGLTAGLGTLPAASKALAPLTAQPAMQAASAIGGGAAQSEAEQAGAGSMGQTIAALMGSLAPGAKAGAKEGLRQLLRGGEAGRQRVAQNIEAFEGAGTVPSVAQATERPIMRGIESGLAKAPGGHGQMMKKAEGQAAEMGARINALADDLAPKTNPTKAGEAIERGISGAGGFVSRFRQKSSELYEKADQFIPSDTPVPLGKTRTLLNQMAAPIQGAPNTSTLLANPKLAAIREALDADLAGSKGALPYEAVKKLRTAVGALVADAGLVADVPKGQLKRLYGALSDDIREQAKAIPKAEQALNRATTHYRAGIDRIDKIERVVGRNGGSEAVFKAAMAGTREGASTLRSVMQSLQPDEAKVVTSAVIRRMGRANPGTQNDVGDKFSAATFLTNWNGMDDTAKKVLLGRISPGMRADMDKIAKVASNLRDGAKVYANPSGTAQAATLHSTGAAFALSVLTGRFDVATGIAAGVAITNGTARAFTSPTFVRWLAQQTEKPVGLLPAQISVLANRAAAAKDEDASEMAQLLSSSLSNGLNEPTNNDGDATQQ